MRTPRLAPLVWLPVWVWMVVGVIVVALISPLVTGVIREPPLWMQQGIEPPVASQAEFDGWLGGDEEINIVVLLSKSGEIKMHLQYRTLLKGVEFDELRERLYEIAETRRNPKDPSRWNPSEVYVLIVADARCSWADVQHVLDTCSDSMVRIYKLRWAVRVKDWPNSRLLDDHKIYLPKGKTLVPTVRIELHREQPNFRTMVKINGEDVASEWTTILESMSFDSEDDPCAEIRVSPDVPYAEVVEVVEFLRVKVWRFSFPPP